MTTAIEYTLALVILLAVLVTVTVEPEPQVVITWGPLEVVDTYDRGMPKTYNPQTGEVR